LSTSKKKAIGGEKTQKNRVSKRGKKEAESVTLKRGSQ